MHHPQNGYVQSPLWLPTPQLQGVYAGPLSDSALISWSVIDITDACPLSHKVVDCTIVFLGKAAWGTPFKDGAYSTEMAIRAVKVWEQTRQQ